MINPSTTITAVGKARRRWRAMADTATAMALTAERRSEISRAAAKARWGEKPKGAKDEGEKA